MIEKSKYLFVEGKNDYHLIRNLLYQHGIHSIDHEQDKNTETIYIVDMGTKHKLDENLEIYLQYNRIQNVGIILDADQSPASTYQSCQGFIEKYGEVANWPTLQKEGISTTLIRSSRPAVSLGIWIMPNNIQTGMLEHFASELIPENDNLWPFAKQTISNLPEKRFPVTNDADHTRKAELHTWLAWQKEPGKPMGQAVTFKYLKSDTPTALNFINWINNVFNNK